AQREDAQITELFRCLAVVVGHHRTSPVLRCMVSCGPPSLLYLAPISLDRFRPSGTRDWWCRSRWQQRDPGTPTAYSSARSTSSTCTVTTRGAMRLRSAATRRRAGDPPVAPLGERVGAARPNAPITNRGPFRRVALRGTIQRWISLRATRGAPRATH